MAKTKTSTNTITAITPQREPQVGDIWRDPYDGREHTFNGNSRWTAVDGQTVGWKPVSITAGFIFVRGADGRKDGKASFVIPTRDGVPQTFDSFADGIPTKSVLLLSNYDIKSIIQSLQHTRMNFESRLMSQGFTKIKAARMIDNSDRLIDLFIGVLTRRSKTKPKRKPKALPVKESHD